VSTCDRCRCHRAYPRRRARWT